MFLPQLSHAVGIGGDAVEKYSVYVGPEGLDGAVRFIADTEGGRTVRVAVLADGMGLVGWLVQNLYSR